MQSVLGLARGMPVKLPPPVEGFSEKLGLQEKAAISRFMTYTALGDARDVKERLREFQSETDADEIILTAQIFDHQVRLHAFEIAAEAMEMLSKPVNS